MGRARGGQSQPRGAAAGRCAEQGPQLRSGAIRAPRTLRRWRRRALRRSRYWDLKSEGRERGPEVDLEEGSGSHVRLALQVHFHSSLRPLPRGVMFGYRDPRYQIAPGLIWGLGICHSAVQTLIFFLSKVCFHYGFGRIFSFVTHFSIFTFLNRKIFSLSHLFILLLT